MDTNSQYRIGIRSRFRAAGLGLLDLIYPPGLYCISCGKITDASRTYGLCNECMESANWITEHHCSKCGRLLSDTNTGNICYSCLSREASTHPHRFDKGYACTGYGTVEQSVIFAFKYGSKSYIGRILGEILADRMLAEYDPDELSGMYDLVVPVPIYKGKKSRRGFNHAGLMAEYFAKCTGLPYESDLIVRTRETLPMKGLRPNERKANINDAFRIREHMKKKVSGARLLLVDDIYTTGATIDEIAALLKAPQSMASKTGKMCENDAPKTVKAHESISSKAGRWHESTVPKAGKEPERATPNAVQENEDTISKAGDRHERTASKEGIIAAENSGAVPGAARVDFLAFAAAPDYLIV